MAVYTNVLREFRDKIEENISLDDVVDELIAERLIDEKLYMEIWTDPRNQVHHLVDVILKDGKRCAGFINVLGKIPHTKQICEDIRTDIDKIRNMIVLGGFPEFSLNYVVRNSIANEIRTKALDLNFEKTTLVIHGLPGFGKSCLVNQILQTKEFLDHSGGSMFWINLGEHQDTTNIIGPLWRLYLNVAKLTNEVPLTHRPEDLTFLQDELRHLFLKQRLKDAFIVLDDVKSSEVLKVFNIRCKLIVTTQDKNIANNSEASFIKVTTGFTTSESFELLKKSLETDNLSSKEIFVQKIHNFCDGFPMLMNIIASILKDSQEEALSTDAIWKSIIDDVKNDHLHHPTTTKVIHMIKKFVKCLEPEDQECFHSLAVFPKHVNIRPELLMRLWDKSERKVRELMVKLENKSLVVSFYNKDLKSYIYSIHSLVRTYLEKQSDADSIRNYHKKMISQYDDIINSSSPEDPVANYLFGYFAYHVKNAGLDDKFEKYFDLNFIENKIKRVGTADLMTDFNTYGDYITKKEPKLIRKLENYKEFVTAYSSHLHVSPETNIVQFAFSYDNKCVYEEAKQIASNNPDHLYFKIDPYSGKQKKIQTLSTKSPISSVCFINSEEILVGTHNGTIEVKCFNQYQHKIRQFEGHTHKVFALEISRDKKNFLSISQDHTLKLWRFPEDLDPQSPRYKQSNWKNLHSPDENPEQSKTFQMQGSDYITSAAFPNDNRNEIVTGSNKGKIIRWNTITGEIIGQTGERGFLIPKVVYSHDNRMIIFSYDGKVCLYLKENFSYNGQFGILDNSNFNDLLLVPTFSTFKHIVAIGGKHVELWEYIHKRKQFNFKADSVVLSSAVNKDSLVLGTKNHIYIYNLKSTETRQYNNDYGEPVSLFILPDRIAFICLKGAVLQRCEIHLEPNEKPVVNDLSLFACYWKESSPIYAIVNGENKIDIFNGHSTILSGIDEVHDEIKCIIFSLCGNNLICGSKHGNVYFYNYKKKKTSNIKVCNEEILFLKCFESDFENVDSFDSCNIYGMVVVAYANEIDTITDGRVEKVLKLADKALNVFYFSNHLVTIDAKCNVIINNLTNKQTNHWKVDGFKEFLVADLHQVKQLLALVYKEEYNYYLIVLKLSVDGALPIEIIYEILLTNEPHSLCFSFSGQLLVIGYENGDLEFLNLANKIHEVISLHKKSVEKLLFAPIDEEPILVSIGDQIAWWNLKTFQINGNELELSEFDSNIEYMSPVDINIWKNKKLHDSVPYLLTSTNLHGKDLRYISTSKDFRSFLIIDSDGNIFKMDIITS